MTQGYLLGIGSNLSPQKNIGAIITLLLNHFSSLDKLQELDQVWKAREYYLVKWISEPYTVQAITIMKGVGPHHTSFVV